jgi:hypothetical protein
VSLSEFAAPDTEGVSPATPTPEPTPEATLFPPGYTEQSISETQAIQTHVGALSDHAYVYEATVIAQNTSTDDTLRLDVAANGTANGTRTFEQEGIVYNRTIETSAKGVTRVYSQNGTQLAEFADETYGTGITTFEHLLTLGEPRFEDYERTEAGALLYYSVDSGDRAIGGVTVTSDGLIRRVWHKTADGNGTKAVEIRYQDSP